MAEEKLFTFSKKQIEELTEYAASGVSEESLAYIFRCPSDRFKELIRTDKDVEYAVYGSRAISSAQVAAALKRSALEGDVRAQQFYLKNRDRTWSDRSPEERDADRNAMHPPKLVIALTQDEDS